MTTKADLQAENETLRAQRNVLRNEIERMRNSTHEFIKKGSNWSNSYLIQHFTELLERTK